MLTIENLRESWAKKILRTALVSGEIGGWKYLEKYAGNVLSPVITNQGTTNHVDDVDSAIEFLTIHYTQECIGYIDKNA